MRRDYCRQAAREMIQTADYRSEQLAVQLNGQAVKFPDAQPEKANEPYHGSLPRDCRGARR